MIFRNKYFISSAGLAVLQQVSLAASTYFIALAGESLISQQYATLRKFVVLFFAGALLAYFLSSCSEYLLVKLKNSLWEKYIFDTFETIKFDQNFSSKKNQQLTVNWLTGEAPTTFENVSDFIIGIISIYCNVIFTFFVFSLTLGPAMAGIMVVSIVLSILLVGAFKEHIGKLAGDIQSTKLRALVSVSGLWSNYLFANNYLAKLAHDDFQVNSRKYFKKTERYMIIEQVVACIPIYIAIPSLILMLYLSNNSDITMGVLVAVLPRSLQLFGNVHSLSMYNSKVVLMKYKLKNLNNFAKNLERQDLKKQIDKNRIYIKDSNTDRTFSASEFLCELNSGELKVGRFLITGNNGVGKSSLLKLAKTIYKEAILISPDVNLINYEIPSSSGEHKIKQINSILSQDSRIFLLDEWDANLDAANTAKVEQRLKSLASEVLIIEVRHSKSDSGQFVSP